MINTPGSVLIFAGVGFTALSLILPFASEAKKEVTRRSADIMKEENKNPMLVNGKIPEENKELHQLYLTAEYISRNTKYFAFISLLYLCGASCDLIYIFFLEYLPIYISSGLIILLATLSSLVLVGGLVLTFLYPKWFRHIFYKIYRES